MRYKDMRAEDIPTCCENEFLRDNRGLVLRLCQRLNMWLIKRNMGVDEEDIFASGMIGLLKAKRRFDPSRGYSFSTAAAPCILGEIHQFLRSNHRIHVSHRTTSLETAIRKAGYDLGEVSDETLHTEMGMPMPDIKKVREAAKRFSVGSQETILQTRRDGEVPVRVVDTVASDVDVEMEGIEAATLSAFMSTLSERDRKIWRLHCSGASQKVISQHVNVGQVQVSRLISGIFKKAEKFGRGGVAV